MTKNDTFIKLVLNRVFNDYVYYDNINVISNKIFNILNKDIINKYTKLLKNNLKLLLNTKYDKLILNYNKNNDNDKLIKKYNNQTKLKKLYNDHISNSLFNLLKNYKNRSYNYNNIFKLDFNLSSNDILLSLINNSFNNIAVK